MDTARTCEEMNVTHVKPMGLVVIVAALLSGSVLSAMPLHPRLLEQMRNQPELRRQEQEFEELLRERGINSPTVAPRLRELARRNLDENFNIIAILVDFSDHTASTAAGYFDTLLCGSGTGTLNNYVNEVTYGNVTLVTVNMPSALGWRRAPQTYAYYVDGQRGFGSYPHNAQCLAEDAIALANPAVNFANYDNDGDDYVDALFIIHAGSGYEYSHDVDDIHSHKWQTSFPVPVDGVYAYVYSMEPEYWSSAGDMTCGVYAHEMGHAAFGLPDLYDYGYDSRGLGSWSLMAGGSWNGANGASPAHPDAWCRVEMGAASATVVATNMTGVSIPSIESSSTVFRLWTDGAGGNQFFLVENRRRTGYDSALPSQGLLIYHVDESESGNNNQWYPGHTTFGNYLVALEQADGLYQLDQDLNSGDGGDPFPGSSNRRTFDSSSTPDSRSYAGTNTVVAVRNVGNSAATMTADFYVTNASLTLTSPNGGEVWYTGQSQPLTWTGTGFSGNVRLLLKRTYPSGAWDTLYANTANDGSQAWTVTGPVTTQARARVVSVSLSAIGDTSDAGFTIALPYIVVDQPNGGEAWQINHAETILWTAAGFAGNVKIEINRTYPSGTWDTLRANTANDGGESWLVTGPATLQARVRISSISSPSIRDTCNANFAIFGLPPRVFHDPLGDVVQGGGSVRVLAHADGPLVVASVVMYYRTTGAMTFDSLILSATTGDEFGASLGGLATGSYEYYIRVADNYGTATTLPPSAPAYLYAFDVGDLCGGELAYDDGTAERFNSCNDPDGVAMEWAVKFGPVPVPFALCAARFAVSRIVPDSAHANVRISVYAADGPGGQPGGLLYSESTGSVGNVLGGLPAGTNWAYAILRDGSGLPLVITSPEFYISVANLDIGNVEGFGRDANGANQHRSFFYDPCEGLWFSEDDTLLSDNAYPGNRLIRAVGQLLAGPTITINRVGNSIQLFWNDTGAASYHVYGATVFDGTYTQLGSTSDTFFTVTTVDTAATKKFFEVRSVVE